MANPFDDLVPDKKETNAFHDLIPKADTTAAAKPEGRGILDNASDDDLLSGSGKNLGTAVIKGAAHIPGFVGDLRELADYVGMRVHSAASGKPMEEIQRDKIARDKAISDATPSWLRFTQAPSGQEIAAPVLAQTGDYKPTTEAGKLGALAVESGLSMAGPGGVSRGLRAAQDGTSVVRGILSGGASSVFGGAVAGVISDTIGEATGDPLLGMAIPMAAATVIPSVLRTGSRAFRPTVDPEAQARLGLAREFDVDSLTPGQATGNRETLGLEDRLRNTVGPQQAAVHAIDARLDSQLAAGTNNFRRETTNQRDPMTGQEIGETIRDAYHSARDASEVRRDGMYETAFNPDENVRAGYRPDAPVESIYGLKNAVNERVNSGNMFPPTKDSPKAFRAMEEINQFSDSGGGIHSSSNNLTMPPQGGDPLVTGVSWRSVDQFRRRLGRLRNDAQSSEDRAHMNNIMDAFDEQLGKTNPLLNDARSAHAEHMSTFEPQADNARGVNPFLNLIRNENNPGKAIYDGLFSGTGIKKGTSGPLIQQVVDIIGHDESAMGAFREGMLRRLITNGDSGAQFSPRVAAKNIRAATNGDSSTAYQSLFSPVEMAKMDRYATLLEQVADGREVKNPSKSGYTINPVVKNLAASLLGGVVGGAEIGSHLGHMTGVPGGSVLGMGAGHLAEKAYSKASANRQAATMAAGYVPPASPVATGLNSVADILQNRGPSSGIGGIISLLNRQNQGQ